MPKKPPRLKWVGDATTDGRYGIGRIVDVATGKKSYFLATSPVDDPPPPCPTKAKVKAQAQAIQEQL